MNTNQTVIIGNLVRDPEVKGTQSGKTWSRFTLAASRQIVNREAGEGKEAADFIPCVAWGQDAAAMNGYVKGDRLIVVGRFTSRSWQDQQGVKHYAQEITAEAVGVPVGGARSRQGTQSYAPAGSAPQNGAQGGFGQFGKARPDEDIPF